MLRHSIMHLNHCLSTNDKIMNRKIHIIIGKNDHIFVKLVVKFVHNKIRIILNYHKTVER